MTCRCGTPKIDKGDGLLCPSRKCAQHWVAESCPDCQKPVAHVTGTTMLDAALVCQSGHPFTVADYKP